MLNLFKKTTKRGWLNFVRNSGISIATCFIIGMTIFLVNSLFLFHNVSNFLINALQEKVDISVYFTETAGEEEILGLKDEISKIPEVQDVQYISRAEALDKFIQRYKENPVVIESLAEVGNPLSPTLNIKAREANQYASIISFLDNIPQKEIVQKVDYYERKPVIDRIFAITKNINLFGIILSILLGVVAVLVTFNQIRLAIYSSREEIGIQRLVGASNWFIRGPFLVQGAISGIIAGIVAFLIFGIAAFVISPKINILFSDLNIFQSFLGKFWIMFLIQFIVGIGLGVLSSIFAIRKYLHV